MMPKYPWVFSNTSEDKMKSAGIDQMSSDDQERNDMVRKCFSTAVRQRIHEPVQA
jgi:hypothetical protein